MTSCRVCGRAVPDPSAPPNFCGDCGAPWSEEVAIIDLSRSEPAATVTEVDRAGSKPRRAAVVAVGASAVLVVVVALVWFLGRDDAALDTGQEAEPRAVADDPPGVAAAAEGVDRTTNGTTELLRNDRAVGVAELATLDLGPGTLALRTDQTLELIDLATGLAVAGHELERSAGGTVWFAGTDVVVRSQNRTSPTFNVFDLTTGRSRNYGGFDTVAYGATDRRVLAQEVGKFFGGGRWVTIGIDDFDLDRRAYPLTPANPWPIVTADGVVVDLGGQLVLQKESGDIVLGQGVVTAVSEHAVLIGRCDADLACSQVAVSTSGDELVSGPAIDGLAPLAQGGDTRRLSPDGATLAHIDPASRLFRLIDLETGRPVANDMGRTSSTSLVWTADSSAVILATDSGLVVVNVADGVATTIDLGRRVDQVGIIDES